MILACISLFDSPFVSKHTRPIIYLAMSVSFYCELKLYV